MEYGFYHPDRGYWQAISAPSEETLTSYPKGTIQVDLKPSEFHVFDGSKWVIPATETTVQP